MIVVQWAQEEDDLWTRSEYPDKHSQTAWDHYYQVVKEWDVARIYLENDKNPRDWVVLSIYPSLVEEK